MNIQITSLMMKFKNFCKGQFDRLPIDSELG